MTFRRESKSNILSDANYRVGERIGRTAVSSLMGVRWTEYGQVTLY